MLCLTALLAVSALVSAAPVAVEHNARAGCATLDDDRSMAAPLAASNSKRNGWDNGWYNTFVKEALDCYAQPTYDSDTVSYYKSGSAVAIGCQTHGEEVNGNDVWDFTIRECYVPNDRLKIDYVWVPGMDECSSD